MVLAADVLSEAGAAVHLAHPLGVKAFDPGSAVGGHTGRRKLGLTCGDTGLRRGWSCAHGPQRPPKRRFACSGGVDSGHGRR